MIHGSIKGAAVILESFHFLGIDCGEKENKSWDESGFGGSKKNGLFFFHNLEFIVSQ